MFPDVKMEDVAMHLSLPRMVAPLQATTMSQWLLRMWWEWELQEGV